jgi:glycosyltransferase involved in cell wall biosynthesis
VPKLSVTIITRNEAAHIGAALQSVAWADEIIVVDAESTDETVTIARAAGAQVASRPWPGFVDQKNHAASLATHDWILSVDADERVTPQLAGCIRQALATEPQAAAFRMRRVTWHLGRWIRSTDWYPDYQVRLYDRRRARWSGRYVHEGLTVSGATGELQGELQHYPYRDVSDHLDTIDRYTTAAAAQMREAGRTAGMLEVLGHPPLAFLRNYVARGGFRDGLPGAIVSAMNSYYVFLKFAKLWALTNAGPATRNPGA